ncbi:MAG: AAA family ATPase [Opitutaceae bacterium]
MIYLTEIGIAGGGSDSFPYSVPSIGHPRVIRLHSPVTCLVGANASGKSTLLEAIAIKSRRIVVGGKSLDQDDSLDAIRPYARNLKLTWSRRTGKGFFFRSEDFFNFMRRNKELSAELGDLAERFKDEPLARGSLLGQKNALDSRYGDLNSQSHGEGFLRVFKSRISSGGLYLLDEPEAALSPQSQFSLLYLIREMVNDREGAQFIIATHSPILMSLPGAQILSFDGGGISEEEFDNLDHVQLYRRFLGNPGRFLDMLFSE